MARDIYCRSDILNVLRCAHVASEGASVFCGDAEKLRIYRAGFQRALVAVGLAFGLEPEGDPQLLQPQRTSPDL